jgi:Flp pilus assembly protein TadG
MTRWRRLRGYPASGQALPEFAFIVPMFLMMLFGVMDFGRVIWAYNSLENAAREGARYAIVHGGSSAQTCPVGPASPLVTVPPASSSCPFPSPSKQSIYNKVTSYSIAGGSAVTVTACYGPSCTGNTNTLATNVRGTPVTVSASSTLNLIVPAFLGLHNFTVTGTSTMLVNF